jgi:alkylation response protein AidB-like acyl-CoA dehydrogenase
LGFLGLKFPEEYGGQGGTYLHDAVWVEELARSGGSGGVAAGLNAHTSIAMPPIFNFGTEEQKQRWVAPGIAGEKVGALGITEPGAGSDVAGITTFAERVDGGYVVNGSKTFITNGVRADFLVCAVKTTQEGGHGGISFLVLEREMPGYEVTGKLEKLGWHSSDTGELSFTDVEVPTENLLGEENKGFHLIMANFAWERLLMAIGAVGAMQRLIERSVEYGLEREAFGRPIGRFQAIRHKVAEMATQAEAAKAITYNALRLFHEGQDCIREVTMAKLVTQRAVLEIADEALQIHGGYGYMREYGIERAVRDARLGPIGGGTDEVMKEILGKLMGL